MDRQLNQWPAIICFASLKSMITVRLQLLQSFSVAFSVLQGLLVRCLHPPNHTVKTTKQQVLFSIIISFFLGEGEKSMHIFSLFINKTKDNQAKGQLTAKLVSLKSQNPHSRRHLHSHPAQAHLHPGQCHRLMRDSDKISAPWRNGKAN